MKQVYMDNNATTPLAPEVCDAMMPLLTTEYGNPSSVYRIARRVRRMVEDARVRVATLIGAYPDEIVFTSCGTESDSTAIWSAVRSFPEKRHIITSSVEHSAVKNLVEYLEAREGYRVSVVPVDEKGHLDLAYLTDHLTPDTALVTLMWANNETGVVFPVEQVAEMAKSAGALFHTDAVQAVGKLPIRLAESAIDMLSLSGHKLHAPKGVGALYLRRKTPFAPFLMGGHQEAGRRAGTENTAYLVGLGRAAELAASRLNAESARVRSLRDRLEQTLIERIPRVKINGDREQRLPNTTNLSFEYVEGESILLMMDEAGICASSGSACTSGSLEPSHVLQAMGVPSNFAHGSVRFSLSGYNSAGDVDHLVDTLPPIIERLRQMSPYWGAEEQARGTAAG